MTDTVTAKPVPWRDGHGRVYWQPATSAGDALWDQPGARPVLYRSRTRAERVSRRYVRRTRRDTLSRVERVDD
jgi:hypothetical protein